ncbi:MAG: DoxX family protein [Rhodobacterales bacterium]|nr:DoxX family protein [Pseudomonadota bacterium]MDA1286659.1 DoxX family protein [Pseudomonadota bacterium]NQW15633.1 DoxX family protein [Rhodobacter sp.]
MRWPSIAFECLAAISILIGFQARQTSVMLALYIFWSSFILNYTPGDPVAISAFWRDLASIGGLVLLYSNGRGRYALDSYLQKRELALARSEAVIVQASDNVINLTDDVPGMQSAG